MTEYFVSYFAQTKFGSKRIGSCTIKSEKPITNGEDVEETRVNIRKGCGFKEVVIISITRLGEEE